MITRPLDLAARLRPPPRTFDWFFFLNGGLIALFFSLFASRYVLTPALNIDFRLPVMAGANAEAVIATHHVAVDDSGVILSPAGKMTLSQLESWLKQEAPAFERPTLSVYANRVVQLDIITKIVEVGSGAGFTVALAAVEPSSAAAPAATPR